MKRRRTGIFQKAVETTPGLGADAFRSGLRALTATDRSRIACADTHKLVASVDIDSSLQSRFPNASRWDYAICYQRKTEVVYWVEVHPASPGDVAELLHKFAWLTKWLESEGKSLNAIPKLFVWIATGKTTLIPTAPAARLLAQKGVRHVGRKLHIE